MKLARAVGLAGLLAGCHDFDGAYQACFTEGRCPLDAGSSDAGGGDAGTATPGPAQGAGYLLHTFHSALDQSEVDVANAQGPGFQWYLAQFYGNPSTAAGAIQFFTDGGLRIDGGSLNTNAPSGTSAGWTGIVFGGGAYFEATLLFDAGEVMAANDPAAAPGFCFDSLEHEIGTSQWPGQDAGYAHFISGCPFSYSVWPFSPAYDYGTQVYEYWGLYQQTCPSSFCGVQIGPGTNFSQFSVQTPGNTDFAQPHRYGWLWVPADGGAMGLGQAFFDDAPSGVIVQWAAFTGQPPPPGTAPWTFGVMDQDHLSLSVSAGPGQPLSVLAVDVWQTSTADNLSN